MHSQSRSQLGGADNPDLVRMAHLLTPVGGLLHTVPRSIAIIHLTYISAIGLTVPHWAPEGHWLDVAT